MISAIDLVIRIKNGYLAKKTEIVVPGTKIISSILQKLISEGYVSSFELVEDGIKKSFHVKLSYEKGKAKFTDVKIISKPGKRDYVGADKIPTVLGGLGISLLSTPNGILTGKEARKAHVGGELLFTIW